MKQLTKMGMLLAFGGILASCSNDNIDTPNVGNEQLPTDGKMYAAINISMPGVTGSRAVTDYKDGNASEYAATSGWIYLFKPGSTNGEDNYEFVKGSALASLAWDDNSATDITTSSTTATASFENLDVTTVDNYYALVVLNKSENFPEPEDYNTFGEWKQAAHYNVGNMDSGSNFVMTNAPGSETAIVASTTPTTLVAISKSAFKTSPHNLTPAADIYVQREVAKVEMVTPNAEKGSFAKFSVDNTDNKDFVRFDAWELDITNNEVFPVQVIDGVTGQSGFTTWNTDNTIDSHPFYASDKTFNRVWWAIDPNYNNVVNNYTNNSDQSDVFNHINDGQVNNALIGDSPKTILYARENTMEAPYMDLNQTTSAIVQATYYINPTGGTVPTSGAGTSFIAYGVLKVAVPTDASLKNGISTGKSQVALNSLFEGENLTKVMDALGVDDSTIVVDYYHNGVCYYRIPIRHFEDDETIAMPTNWNTSDTDYTNAYRGRFGLLRNNWYEIKINSVSGLGDPTIPDDPGNTPDDPKNSRYYINATINVLAWAKRSHNYEL